MKRTTASDNRGALVRRVMVNVQLMKFHMLNSTINESLPCTAAEEEDGDTLSCGSEAAFKDYYWVTGVKSFTLHRLTLPSIPL